MKKILPIMLIIILVFSGLGVGAISIRMPSSQQSSSLDEYDMAIIAPDEFSNTIQPLIDHKNSVGIRTFLKTTEEIYEECEGRDKAEKIKYCIYESVENFGIEYVLLIGDIHTTPIRKTEVKQIWSEIGWIQIYDIITDLYYADIYNTNGDFSSWDSNDDNIFSEYYLYNLGRNPGERVIIDEVDLYPDIGVGRIPCENKDELRNVVDKIITYETQDNTDFFHNIILAGSDGFSAPGYQGEMITEQIAEVMTGFTPIKLYESTGNLNPSMINKEINNGAGFFICSAHGSPWNAHNYTISSINNLDNKNKLPIAFLTGCGCGAIDYSKLYHVILKISEIYLEIAPNGQIIYNFLLKIFNNVKNINLEPCIAWELLNYEYGGSIATIAITRSGSILNNPTDGFNGLFCFKFFESYEPGISLSNMYNKAITLFIDETWKDYVTLQMHILLGDPSLKIGGYS